jgi:hypothetical protein
MNRIFKKEIALQSKIEKLNEALENLKKEKNIYQAKVIEKNLYNLVKNCLDNYPSTLTFYNGYYPDLKLNCDFSSQNKFEKKFLKENIGLNISDEFKFKDYRFDIYMYIVEPKPNYYCEIPIHDMKTFINLFKFDIKNMTIENDNLHNSLQMSRDLLKISEDLHLIFK